MLALMSLISVTLFMPESPRFLYSQKRFSECKEVLKKIIEMNGKKIDSDFMFEAELDQTDGDDSTSKEGGIVNNSVMTGDGEREQVFDSVLAPRPEAIESRTSIK